MLSKQLLRQSSVHDVIVIDFVRYIVSQQAMKQRTRAMAFLKAIFEEERVDCILTPGEQMGSTHVLFLEICFHQALIISPPWH